MSFRELSMFDIRDLLRRAQAGEGVRAIARKSGVDRKTVRRYVEAATERGFGKDHALEDDFVRAVVAAVQDRPSPAPSEPRAAIERHRDKVAAWLQGEEPLRLTRVHELLRGEGLDVGYTTLRRYAHQELGWRQRKASVRVDDPPFGDEAQIDFALMGQVPDGYGGTEKLYVLIVVLSASRHMFVWPCLSQTARDVIEGLEAAWRFFGGIPKRIVPDNATSMIVKASATDPVKHRAFAEYTDKRAIFVDPARVRSPQDKARVENQVAHVRERWFAGETFTPHLERTREHAARWCREVAGARIHGTTRQKPLECYEEHERPRMQPAPVEIYDVPTWRRSKVHHDHHIQVEKALYSMPTLHVGREVLVRADKTTVRVYLNDELIKLHPRGRPGSRTTDPADYPANARDPAFRTVERLLTRARAKPASIAAFAEKLLDGPTAWMRMRQGYALMRLCERYGDERVEAMCSHALKFGVVDVSRVERLLKDARRAEEEASPKLRTLPVGRFARPTTEFSTRGES